MIKRTISAILVLVIALSAASFSAFASDLNSEDALKEKCIDALMKEYHVPEKYRDEVYVEFAVSFDSYIVFRGTYGPSPDLCTHQYIDGYWFYGGAIYADEDTNPTGIYALDNYGNLRTLKETADMDFIDMDGLFEVLPDSACGYLRGDADSDKRLTVKDATLIQKYLAHIPEAMDTAYKHFLGNRVMDYDLSGGISLYGSSGGVSVKDATAIQKKVAGIGYDFDCQLFDYETVLVYVEGECAKDYTPDDFTECNVEHVEKAELESTNAVIYTLYLYDPSKEAVIDAVNALTPRVGTEFTEVSANYIMVPC